MAVHQQTKRQDAVVGPQRPPTQQQQSAAAAAIGPPRPPAAAVGPPRPPSQAAAAEAAAGQGGDGAGGSMGPPRRPGAGWMTVEDLIGPPAPSSGAADEGAGDEDGGECRTLLCSPTPVGVRRAGSHPAGRQWVQATGYAQPPTSRKYKHPFLKMHSFPAPARMKRGACTKHCSMMFPS